MVLHDSSDAAQTRDAYHSVHVFGLLFAYLAATQPSTTEQRCSWVHRTPGVDPTNHTTPLANLAYNFRHQKDQLAPTDATVRKYHPLDRETREQIMRQGLHDQVYFQALRAYEKVYLAETGRRPRVRIVLDDVPKSFVFGSNKSFVEPLKVWSKHHATDTGSAESAFAALAPTQEAMHRQTRSMARQVVEEGKKSQRQKHARQAAQARWGSKQEKTLAQPAKTDTKASNQVIVRQRKRTRHQMATLSSLTLTCICGQGKTCTLPTVTIDDKVIPSNESRYWMRLQDHKFMNYVCSALGVSLPDKKTAAIAKTHFAASDFKTVASGWKLATSLPTVYKQVRPLVLHRDSITNQLWQGLTKHCVCDSPNCCAQLPEDDKKKHGFYKVPQAVYTRQGVLDKQNKHTRRRIAIFQTLRGERGKVDSQGVSFEKLIGMRTECYMHRERHVDDDDPSRPLVLSRITRQPSKISQSSTVSSQIDESDDDGTPLPRRSKTQPSFSPTERAVASDLSQALAHVAKNPRVSSATHGEHHIDHISTSLIRLLDTPQLESAKESVAAHLFAEQTTPTRDDTNERIESFIDAQVKLILGVSRALLKAEFEYFNARGALDSMRILAYDALSKKMPTGNSLASQRRKLSAWHGFVAFKMLFKSGFDATQYIAYIFGVSDTTLRRYYKSYLIAIAFIGAHHQPYPTYKAMCENLPDYVAEALGINPQTAVFVGDATERKCAVHWSINYSQYKSTDTVKNNQVCTLDGYVVEVTPNFVGSISVNELHTVDNITSRIHEASRGVLPRRCAKHQP
eukprot:m.350286 g.350286  ORF g.350286 m.350286 type:complete len:796 (+) comp16158_c0_seq2:5969-8356(+)